MSDTGRPGGPEQSPGSTGPTHRPAATPQGAPPLGTGGWAAHGEGTPPGAAPETSGPDGDATHGGRPRWLLPAAVGAGVVVVVAVVAVVLGSRGGDAESPAPAASTVLLPVPTPAVAPAERAATTAFASALPTAVLQYALESSQEDTEWTGAGALEAWAETFTDGEGGTLTVRAAQHESVQDATAFLQRAGEGLPAPAPADDAAADEATQDESPDTDAVAFPQSGEVLVGGEPVGTYTVVDAGDGTGVALWQNGTAVFRLTAPIADVLDAYTAYGL
ncbi:hypothetical protein Cfla_0568 [Cellulomonas flavigena DSM 20109]|uniref:Uncharacterized protein n=1 Tax=Cellulomonas flavigena (strain ATCC 482 / DSM 20109 / BCRC 11376 / JCM 18109 / NBRC 3775 / NCIMB 8073 / NRS 134) TaxID=446466 RepID=D5UII1_CELFN|nr:hypothetical protein [Cellulomonas flavigena]ADG73480.1 hypothetical protein Cfla_0568 [Cellulomonas flavigena DSM 20109]